MDITLLKYPKKSHRKAIILPQESEALAEFMGIVLGDGGLNSRWQLGIYLNSIVDQKFSKYVCNLIESLFGLSTTILKKKNKNCISLVVTSTTLVDFLVSKGAVLGDKVTSQVKAPDWLYKDLNFEKRFVRGLMDTDGGLYTHKHIVLGKQYLNLGLCFCSHSLPLVQYVAQIMLKYGMNPHVTKKGWLVSVYKFKDIQRYLEIIGSSNPRLTDKFFTWRGRLVD